MSIRARIWTAKLIDRLCDIIWDIRWEIMFNFHWDFKKYDLVAFIGDDIMDNLAMELRDKVKPFVLTGKI